MAVVAHPTIKARLRDLPEGLIDGLVLLAALRLGLGLVGLLVVAESSVPGPCHFELAFDGWRTTPPLASGGWEFPLVGIWQRWDACWYSKIATFGYEPGEAGVAAFYPLVPLLMRLVDAAWHTGPALAGLIVDAIAFVLAAVGLRRLVEPEYGRAIARRTVLYVAIAPASFFLFAPFTEATFLAASIWALLCARERRWGLAAVAGLVAGLSRFQGVFLVLPIAWEAWRAWSGRSGSSLHGGPAMGPGRLGHSAVEPQFRAASLLAMFAPLIAVAVFSGFTGSSLGTSSVAAQDLWGGRDLRPPWEVIGAAASWTVAHHDPIEAVNVGALLGAVFLFVAGLRRLPVAWSLWALPQIALVALRLQPTPLTSTTRYVLVIFPLFVVVALATRWRPLHEAWVITSLLLMGVLVTFFLRGTFVA